MSLILSAALAISAIYPVNTHVGDGRNIVGIDKAYEQGSTVDRAGSLELVKQDGRNLAKLDDGLKSDREIVLEAVTPALESPSHRLVREPRHRCRAPRPPVRYSDSRSFRRSRQPSRTPT